MKAKVLFIALFILNIFQVSAQNTDEVTLVVSADGATKEEATKVALRSAIEQAYGTFVSANTTILNDEMVKDEIVTISNGNIKDYKEIASMVLPNGNQSVTLQATVCISKLVSYAQSKGASTEFAGATFGMNLKLYELNKKNEKNALDNLLLQVKEIIPSCFDTRLNIKEPVVKGNNCILPLTIQYVPNNNYNELCKLVLSTVDGISVKEGQYIPQGINTKQITCYLDYNFRSSNISYTLRNDNNDFCFDFNNIFVDYFFGFEIVDNTGQTSSLCFDKNITRENRKSLLPIPKSYKGTGIFSTYSLKWEAPNLLLPFRDAWFLLNLGFSKFDKNSNRVMEASSIKIDCTIPVTDISNYSSFTIKDK